MIAIVKQNDVAGTGFFEPPLRTRGGLGVPIVSVHRPHHDLRKTRRMGGSEELRAAETEGRPDTSRTLTCCSNYSIVAPRELIDDAPAAEEHKAWVCIRVIPDDVIAGCDLRCETGMLAGIFSQYKKCRLYVVFLEKRQKTRRDTRIGAVVECEGAGVASASNHRAE